MREMARLREELRETADRSERRRMMTELSMLEARLDRARRDR